MYTLEDNIMFQTKEFSDALLRLQLDRFRCLEPQAGPQPTPVIEELMRYLLGKFGS